MDDQLLLRYSRHILLEEIGIEGQERLSAAKVLVIGAGGLASNCAPYLVAAGVHTLSIADDDMVDLTNLQRQIMHTMDSIGLPKVDSAKRMLARINPNTNIQTFQQRADATFLDKQLPAHDIVVDCSDNFKTRHLVNRKCVEYRKPLVFGAAIKFDGQYSVFDTRRSESPCYACIFPEEDSFEEVSCSSMGVFATLIGIIGSLQAAQTLQVIANIGTPMIGRLGLWDALHSENQIIQVARHLNCPVCSQR